MTAGVQEWALYLAVVVSAVALLRCSANPLRHLRLGIFRPFRLLLTFWVAYLSVSYLGTFWLVQQGIFSPIDFRLAFGVQLLALVGVGLGVNLVHRILVPSRTLAHCDRRLTFDLAFLEIVSSVAVVACTIATILWFVKTGVIPMLYDGDKDAIRFELNSGPGLGLLTRFMYLSPLALMLKLTCFSLPGKRRLWIPRWFDAASLLGIFVALSLYGSKMLYVAGFVLWLLNYHIFVRRLKPMNWRWILGGVLTVILLTIITNIRGTGSVVVIDPVSDLLVVFPEFRDMAQTLNIAEEHNLHTDSLWVGIVSAIPRELYDIFGFDKPTARMQELAYFQKQLLGYEFSGGSARTGLFAELFLDARWTGVLAGSLILGLLFGWVEQLLAGPHLFSFGVILANVLTVELSWFLLAELPTQAPIVYLYLYFMAVVYLLVRRSADAPVQILPVSVTS